MLLFKDRSLEERKLLVKAMVVRMAEAYGVKKSQLPKVFDCSKGIVNNWSYYGRIPYDYLGQCREETGKSMDWLLYGEEMKNPLSSDNVDVLKSLHAKVMKDGVSYGMLQECYEGALAQLKTKYDEDIDAWAQPLLADNAVNEE